MGTPLKGIICEICEKPITDSDDVFVEEDANSFSVIFCGACWDAEREECAFEEV